MVWYENSEGRHGKNGAKGDAGEKFVSEYFEKRGFEWKHLKDPHSQYNRGIDFIVNGYPIDVKTNGKENTLTVELKKEGKQGWLYKSEAVFIFGVDLKQKEIYVYRLVKMREYVKENINKAYYRGDDLLIKVPKTLEFIKRLQ